MCFASLPRGPAANPQTSFEFTRSARPSLSHPVGLPKLSVTWRRSPTPSLQCLPWRLLLRHRLSCRRPTSAGNANSCHQSAQLLDVEFDLVAAGVDGEWNTGADDLNRLAVPHQEAHRTAPPCCCRRCGCGCSGPSVVCCDRDPVVPRPRGFDRQHVLPPPTVALDDEVGLLTSPPPAQCASCAAENWLGAMTEAWQSSR